MDNVTEDDLVNMCIEFVVKDWNRTWSVMLGKVTLDSQSQHWKKMKEREGEEIKEWHDLGET